MKIKKSDFLPIYRSLTALLDDRLPGSKLGDVKQMWGLGSDKIPDGLADQKPDSDFDAAQIEKGIQVETEHTTDREIAKKIAKDHLSEDSEYYVKLEKMEASHNTREDQEVDGAKKVIEADIKDLYNICKKAYDNSYAKMADDVFNAGKKKAKELGINWNYDSGLQPYILDEIVENQLYNPSVYEYYLYLTEAKAGKMKELQMENEGLTVEEAHDFGADAFHAGKKRVPAHDKELMDKLPKDAPIGTSTKLFTAWLKGWDTENINKNVVAGTNDFFKNIKKDAADWELVIEENYDPKLDKVVGYFLNTFEDRSVGLYGIHLGEFTADGFNPDDSGLGILLESFDSEEQSSFESFLQKIEKEIKKHLKTATASSMSNEFTTIYFKSPDPKSLKYLIDDIDNYYTGQVSLVLPDAINIYDNKNMVEEIVDFIDKGKKIYKLEIDSKETWKKVEGSLIYSSSQQLKIGSMAFYLNRKNDKWNVFIPLVDKNFIGKEVDKKEEAIEEAKDFYSKNRGKISQPIQFAHADTDEADEKLVTVKVMIDGSNLSEKMEIPEYITNIKPGANNATPHAILGDDIARENLEIALKKLLRKVETVRLKRFPSPEEIEQQAKEIEQKAKDIIKKYSFKITL